MLFVFIAKTVSMIFFIVTIKFLIVTVKILVVTITRSDESMANSSYVMIRVDPLAMATEIGANSSDNQRVKLCQGV